MQRRRTSTVSSAVVLVVLAALVSTTNGFQTMLPRVNQLQQVQRKTLTQQFIFGRDKGEPDEKKENSETSSEGGDRGILPFFSRLLRKDEMESEAASVDESTSESSNTASTSVMEKTTEKVKVEPKFEDLSPIEQAKIFRAQAEKARLEAERMDAELTLEKIGRLERELQHAKKMSLTNNVTGQIEMENLMRELDVLEAKMRGETLPPPKTAQKPSTPSSSRSSSISKKGDKGAPKGDFFSRLPENVEPFDEEQFQGVLREFNGQQSFMKKAMATQVCVPCDNLETLNATEVAVRLDKMNRFDYAFGGYERPSFTQEEIDKMKEGLASNRGTVNGMVVDPRLKDMSAGNETEWALMALEYQYFTQKYSVTEEEVAEFVMEGADSLTEMLGLNISAADNAIEQFYPKCTRKQGQEPTEAQVKQLMTDVLPKAKFSTTAKPEKVLGGFIVRGTSRYDSGDDLIKAIDEQLEKTSLKDKMTVLYARDFTVFTSDNVDEPPDLATLDPILYVVGKDIVREPSRVLLSLTSGLGLATCWYLSLYPFLLNPTIASRVDEELALVDAGMTPDLSWLTDLSIPLFVTFVGIQFFHEIGHRIVAMTNGIKPTFPTFVPSIITGVTTTVTTFKEPPKNSQAMFDFSVAGPLFGMVSSLFAVLVGSQLTVTADPATLPSMPLEILRQSSLAGGILDAVIGNGVLSVPDGALGTSAVSTMTIPLHPVAVAGFIGLIVNALNVLPVGTTDGGRMAQALFGRGAKLLIGNLFLLAILTIGIGGSDLFLFYFAFCIAFQTGNEVPARNEVDDVDISRIFVAITSYLIAALALIPLQ